MGDTEIQSIETLLKIKNMKKKLSNNIGLTKVKEVHMQMEKSLLRNDVIHSFEEINWIDPFPEQDAQTTIDGTPIVVERTNVLDRFYQKDLIYDEDKFTAETPPKMIYVPDKVLLRKMMKVCAGLETWSDLYYFF